MAQNYTLPELENFRDANKDFISFRIVDNVPVLEFQDNTVSGVIKFATRLSDGMPMYLEDNGDSTYRFITYANVTNVGFYNITDAFDNWLTNNYSHLFGGLNLLLDNGNFTNVYVTKKPNYVYSAGAYTNLWDGWVDMWSVPEITSYASYLDGLSGYDIRILNDVDWYDQAFKDGISNYIVNGIDNPIITPESPVVGNNYDATHFTNLRAANKDFVGLFAEGDVFNLLFQDDTTDGDIKLVDFNDGTVGYVRDLLDGNYQFIGHENTLANALVVIDSTVSHHLETNYSQMLSGLNITLDQGTYTNVFVTKSPTYMDTNLQVIALDVNDPMYWDVPNLTDISSWLGSIANYDVKFYPNAESASWYDQGVKDGIRDAIITALPTDPIDPNTVTVVPSNELANLIYSKSLYESSIAYFDSTITRLEQELQEEQNLEGLLSGDNAVLIADLQSFIDNKSVEVNNKLTYLKQVKADLEALVAQNLISIQNNGELNSLLQSEPATSLSNNILELRDDVYNALKFLSDNGRLGSNNDILFEIDMTQI